MNRLITLILVLLLFDLLFQQCANPRSPTGGPKDTIPPTLTSSYPTNGSTDFKELEIRLEFSEFISADNLQQKLIITPQTDVKYKTVIRRDELVLKFEESLADSTTYNLNFADAIVDITEKNPAVNLSLAFSTGSFIDSMSFKGDVIDLFQRTPVSGYTVGLYPFSDTLDYFTDKPIYFTTTNDSGNFNLTYLKKGIYRLLVFNDENRNILLDPDTEQHGFISSTIELDSAIELSSSIPTLLQNVKPIEFINSRPTGLYFELKYNKLIHEYTVLPDSFYHNLIGEKDVIRIYRPSGMALDDSTQLIVTAIDSLQNSTTDTVQAIYFDSNRKPSDLTYSINKNRSILSNENSLKLTFNKPIISVDSTKFFYRKDSTFIYPIRPSFSWNENLTNVNVTHSINKAEFLTSLLESIPKDTSLTDSISANSPDRKVQLPKSIELVIDSAAFISVESDSTIAKTHSVMLEESSNYGTIKFSLDTELTSFQLQLLDSRDKVLYTNNDAKEFTFPRITPGTYKIRVLIDDDLDGKWSAGNLLLNREPEEVYLHPEETSVRENWVLELSISF